MSEISIALPRQDKGYVGQLTYSLSFCHPAIQDFHLDGPDLTVRFEDGARAEDVEPRVRRLVERFAGLSDDFVPKEVFRVPAAEGGPARPDPYDELVERGWVVPVYQGQVVLRGLALDLVEFFDAESLRLIAGPMGARPEYYPSGISCDALAKTAHFSSFPEHIQFVSHLTPDVHTIDGFTARYREGESIAHASASGDGVFDLPAVVMNPSVCYHCYNALAGAVVEKPGLAVTARSRCQRFEGGNHATLRRLMDFSMREVIFVGQPPYVLETRAETLRLLEQMFRRWELACWLESSNDPFFTDDYATKAAFQRHQDLKYELRAALPFEEGASLAVASSNYHSVTFGKAFEIKVGGRPACTGCLGFGLERLMYVVFAQYGTDPAGWPIGLREDFEAWRTRQEVRA
jgi:hypothetical protein